jgi:hypothetical protein
VNDASKPLFVKGASQSQLPNRGAAEPPLPKAVDAAFAALSRSATPPTVPAIIKKRSANQQLKAPLANKSTNSAQVATAVDIDATRVSTSVSIQTKGNAVANGKASDKGGSGDSATRLDNGQNEAKAKVKAKKDKGGVPNGLINRLEKKEGDVKDTAKNVAKPPRSSKATMMLEVAPKAGPSRQIPVAEIPHMAAVVAGQGKGNRGPAKRQKKAEEGDEGPVKKQKVAKDGIAAVERLLPNINKLQTDDKDLERVKKAKSSRNSDPSSSKAKTKKTNPASNSSSHALLLLDIDSSQLAELQGMLIESFAVSRASSLPPSALYCSIADSRPSLKSERSQEQWVELIEAVLEEGQSNTGVFGKVESSFKVRFHSVVLCM